jgi:hypothetical protein
MPIRSSGGGCGGFLLGWCILFGVLTILAGLGFWGQLGAVLPGYWIIGLVFAVGLVVILVLIK